MVDCPLVTALEADIEARPGSAADQVVLPYFDNHIEEVEYMYSVPVKVDHMPSAAGSEDTAAAAEHISYRLAGSPHLHLYL